MALLRAVEQGFSLVRPANHGLNVVTDYQGRVLGRLDHYATSDRRLSAAVPERGVTTVYQRTGDALPWFSLGLTVFFLALLLRHYALNDSPNGPRVNEAKQVSPIPLR